MNLRPLSYEPNELPGCSTLLHACYHAFAVGVKTSTTTTTPNNTQRTVDQHMVTSS